MIKEQEQRHGVHETEKSRPYPGYSGFQIPSEDPSAPVQLRNVRYLYDNPGTNPSFAAASQIEGGPGSGTLLAAPLDTANSSAILELSNVTASPITVYVDIYTDSGMLRRNLVIDLSPFASYHYITDSILMGERGVVTVRASDVASLLAVVMQYQRGGDGSVDHMYAISAVEAMGTDFKGSYNTFLSQTDQLWLIDSSGVTQTVRFGMTRADGAVVLSDHEVTVPAHGLAVVQLDPFVGPDHYGMVSVQAALPGSVVGWTLRRKGDEFVIPVPIR